MTELRMHDAAPAAAQAADWRTATHKVVDDRGRTLAWRFLEYLEEVDLMLMVGDKAQNREWFSHAMVACMLREVDGSPVAFPATEAGLRANMQRVGRDGYKAILEDSARVAEADGGPEREQAAAKN